MAADPSTNQKLDYARPAEPGELPPISNEPNALVFLALCGVCVPPLSLLLAILALRKGLIVRRDLQLSRRAMNGSTIISITLASFLIVIDLLLTVGLLRVLTR